MKPSRTQSSDLTQLPAEKTVLDSLNRPQENPVLALMKQDHDTHITEALNPLINTLDTSIITSPTEPSRASFKPAPFAPLSAGLAASALLAACGGGGDDPSTPMPPTAPPPGTPPTAPPPTAPPPGTPPTAPPPAADTLLNLSMVVRFLSHSTLGFSYPQAQSLVGVSMQTHLQNQMQMPVSFPFMQYYQERLAAQIAKNPNFMPQPVNVQEVFWGWCLNPIYTDTLRQRITFTLSQHFVVSTTDSTLSSNPQAIVSYYKMLAECCFGTLFDLLRAVTLHPAMGTFLTYIKNVKENPAKGTIPDQNYARELMQLFTIGIRTLSIDGVEGTTEVYGQSDVENLSRVFTGLSYGGPDTSEARFYARTGYKGPEIYEIPMQAYEQYHSTSPKTFLQTSITPSNTLAEVDQALRALIAHPNCAPFIAKNMIVRLTTSNPPPEYVARVATAFKNSGYDLAVLWRSIFTDSFVISNSQTAAGRFSQLGTPLTQYTVRIKDPLERYCHLAKSVGISAPTGYYYLGDTSDPATSLGQNIFRAPSVFNFTRPAYSPKGTAIASSGGISPEFQLRNEVSVFGYVRAARRLMDLATTSETYPSFADWTTLAANTTELLQAMSVQILAGRPLSASSTQKIQLALDQLTISPTATDTQRQTTLRNRSRLCALLLSITPEAELGW